MEEADNIVNNNSSSRNLDQKTKMDDTAADLDDGESSEIVYDPNMDGKGNIS